MKDDFKETLAFRRFYISDIIESIKNKNRYAIDEQGFERLLTNRLINLIKDIFSY